jgi:hypothetical protein
MVEYPADHIADVRNGLHGKTSLQLRSYKILHVIAIEIPETLPADCRKHVQLQHVFVMGFPGGLFEPDHIRPEAALNEFLDGQQRHGLLGLGVDRVENLSRDPLGFSFAYLLCVGDLAIHPDANNFAIFADGVFTIGQIPAVTLAVNVSGLLASSASHIDFSIWLVGWLAAYGTTGGARIDLGRDLVIGTGAGVAPDDAERSRLGDAVGGVGAFARLRGGPDPDGSGFVLEHAPDGAGVEVQEFGQLRNGEMRLDGGRWCGFRARFLHGTS